ncbi:hypothetical protein M011DRAFT_101522 [Sporormia fimetaria CBS 119925]|uniref:Uncharacterized protein n=1 Tax=Sporormia fimetaria CBS 119925 TaxID=1340428 RepID=A0A6A6VKH8_9PLEO|nr:hypothetical protein M011DRAFT_101522 [Sporormia fimetaria CBS 119925]
MHRSLGCDAKPFWARCCPEAYLLRFCGCQGCAMFVMVKLKRWREGRFKDPSWHMEGSLQFAPTARLLAAKGSVVCSEVMRELQNDEKQFQVNCKSEEDEMLGRKVCSSVNEGRSFCYSVLEGAARSSIRQDIPLSASHMHAPQPSHRPGIWILPDKRKQRHCLAHLFAPLASLDPEGTTR